MSDEYKKNLKAGAVKHAKEQKLSEREYDDFVNFKKADGISHKDWASAFKKWCSNALKYGRTASSKPKSKDLSSTNLDNYEL